MRHAFVYLMALAAWAQEEDQTVVETPQSATESLERPRTETELTGKDKSGTDSAKATPPLTDAPPHEVKPETTSSDAPSESEEPGNQAASVIQADPTRQEKRAAGNEAKEPDQHVVSQSRIFSVSGGDSLRMGAIATKADEIRGRVCQLLGFDSDWKYSISIRLLGQSTDPPEPNPIRTRISIIGQEPNFQIRIYPGGGINLDKLTNAIIMMTLYERALRDIQTDALPDVIKMPEWLVTGVQQAILWRSGKADRRLYQNLFNRAEMLSPEEIISTKNASLLDASSRQVYEVSCGVLVMSLVNRDGGQAQLRELVTESVTEEGTPAEIIASHFHELGIDSNMLSKWWALELAALSQAPATESLTPMETEKQLTEALTILRYNPYTRTPEPISADDLYTLVELEDWKEQMRPCVDRLMELNLRCFPGYRPLIMEYVRAISELLQGSPPDEVQNIIGPLRELRQTYITTSIRARDYLDWYEITQMGNASYNASFNNYLEAMSTLRKETPGPKTQISQYLEDIETLYSLGEEEELPSRMKLQTRSSDKQETRHEEEK